jgi:hypothetical protein
MLVRLIDGRIEVVVDHELMAMWTVGVLVTLVVNILS